MRFPSVRIALHNARATLLRFPLAVLAGLVATVVMLLLIDNDEDWHARLVATAILGLPLFTASVTTAERHRFSRRKRLVADLAILVALALVYRGSLNWTGQQAFLRFTQLLLAGHLLAAVGPYLTEGSDRGFWQYNRFLFLRYLVATLYAVVLWIGLAIALAAMDQLFGIDVSGDAYARLFAILAFAFHPWFFLSGVPLDHRSLDQLDDYPLGLKRFSQFVLIPLVVIYLAILTAYLGKVLITQTWPSGWIGYLVSSVSVTGVLALLLVHPIRGLADSGWVGLFARWWFIALLPALVMLLLATSQRIAQYGITEPRYFLLALGVWLLGLALYYAVSGSPNIKLIPLTLAGLALLTSLGPWGAYSSSRRSQARRFHAILAANGIDPERGGGTAGTVTREDRRELSAILRYVHEVHGPRAVRRLVGVPRDSMDLLLGHDSTSRLDDPVAARALARFGVAYLNRWEAQPSSDGTFWANVAQPGSVAVSGYELARPMSYPGLGWVGTPQDSLELAHGAGDGIVQVRHQGVVVLTLDLGDAARRALPSDSLQAGGSLRLAAPVSADGSSGGFRVRFLMESIGGRVAGDSLVVKNASGYVLVSGLPPRRP